MGVTPTRWSRVYRRTLGLLPQDFRLSYEEELVAAFDESLEESGASRLRVWLASTWDVLCWTIRLRWRSRSRLHRASRAKELPLSETLFQDVRFALRQLSRAPGTSGVIVVTLGLVLAATASLFSVVNATLLEPLPFREPDRVVFLKHVYADMVGSGTPPLLMDYRREIRSLQSVSASYPWNANLTGDGDPERLRGLRVTADFFSTLGVDAFRGRVFLPNEDTPGQSRVVLLSHGLWHRRFGGEEDVVGSRIELNGDEYRVVGVMPPGFHWGRGWGKEAIGDVWAPLELTAELTADSQRGTSTSTFMPGSLPVRASSSSRPSSRSCETTSGVGSRIAIRSRAGGESSRSRSKRSGFRR